jgi:hypothetical protein
MSDVAALNDIGKNNAHLSYAPIIFIPFYHFIPIGTYLLARDQISFLIRVRILSQASLGAR